MSHEAYDRYVAENPPVFTELRALFSPDKVRRVFDVGACEGEESLRYARLFPRAEVYAFEPLTANQTLIRHHFERCSARRCRLVAAALSDRNGLADLHVSSGAPAEKPKGEEWNYGNKSSSLLAPNEIGKIGVDWLEFKTTETVRTIRLDDFCREEAIDGIDFVHIDVQGSEWLVLQGASATLPRIKCLWIEVAEAEIYKGQRVGSEIDAFLREHGFRQIRRICNGVESDVMYVNLAWASCRLRWWTSRMSSLADRVASRLRRLLRSR